MVVCLHPGPTSQEGPSWSWSNLSYLTLPEPHDRCTQHLGTQASSVHESVQGIGVLIYTEHRKATVGDAKTRHESFIPRAGSTIAVFQQCKICSPKHFRLSFTTENRLKRIRSSKKRRNIGIKTSYLLGPRPTLRRTGAPGDSARLIRSFLSPKRDRWRKHRHSKMHFFFAFTLYASLTNISRNKRQMF
jgi:hypothetical protein